MAGCRSEATVAHAGAVQAGEILPPIDRRKCRWWAVDD
jgi:hypothetical protein